MKKEDKIPFLKISAAGHYEFGRKLGDALRSEIAARLKKNRALYQKFGISFNEELGWRSMGYFNKIKRYYPRMVEEITGLADGAGQDLAKIMVLVSEEEWLTGRHQRCTSLAVRTDEGIVLGHNEDWDRSYRRDGMYLVKAKIGKEKFLALSYVGCLPGGSAGLNSFGLAYTGNSLFAGRPRIGVPRSVQMRLFLSADSLSEVKRFDLKHSTIGGNTLVVWRNKAILDEEELGEKYRIFREKNYLVHTNHPLLVKDKTRANYSLESRQRYDRAMEILSSAGNLGIDSVKKVLTNHQSGICSHWQKGGQGYQGVTIASVIINPLKGNLELAWSNPCRNKYHNFFL